MIPYALMGAEIKLHTEKKIQIRFLELSPDGFSFRLSKNSLTDIQEIRGIMITAYLRRSGAYRNLEITDFEITSDGEEKFWKLYRVSVRDPEFKKLSGEVSREYLEYIDLKLYEAPAFVSKELCGYPAEEEEIFAGESETVSRQKEGDSSESFAYSGQPGLGIALDHPERYRLYLEKPSDSFFSGIIARTVPCGHPVSEWKVTHLYIGNAYCIHLFPGLEELQRLLTRTAEEEITPVLVLPPARESVFSEIRELLEKLPEMELVVNDFGMLSYLARTNLNQKFTVNYGTMLNRRRKDTRLKYKTGLNTELLKENPLNLPEYIRYLKKTFGVRRFSFEACGYEYRIPDVDGDLHLPYYQMNTSGFCTLAAAAGRGNRGNQEPSLTCPKYCMEKEFLYPEFLKMTGKYNSIFGYDDQILFNGDYFGKMTEKGIRRIVLEVPG